MGEVSGQGPYLLLIDYGQEGWGIYRFPDQESLLIELYAQTYHGQGWTIARELSLKIEEDEEEKP